MNPLTVLARIPRFETVSESEFEAVPLPGLTNDSYLITVAEERFVLRIPGPGTRRFIDRRQERRNTLLAASAGICPEVVWCDADSGVMLSRYVATRCVADRSALSHPATLERAVDLLRRLHHSALAFSGCMRALETAERYMALCESAGDAARRRVQRLRPLLDNLRERDRKATRDGADTPCHVDPVAQNFLLGNERLWLIDWEYSAMADPFWDLAYLCRESALDAAGRDRVLQRYQGTATPALRNRLQHQMHLVDLVNLAWLAARIATADRTTHLHDLFDRRCDQVGTNETNGVGFD